MNIQNQKLDASSAWAKVTYIPSHAKGYTEHPDIEEGTISSWDNKYVFVNYGMGKGVSTEPNDLVWDHVVGVNKMVEHGRVACNRNAKAGFAEVTG